MFSLHWGIIILSVSCSYCTPRTLFAKEVNMPTDFQLRQPADSIAFPWNKISLTGEQMKPGYPFIIPVAKPFPWIPVIGGVVGTGTLVYFLTNNNKEEDCSFSASAHPTSSFCGLANGSININTSIEASYQWSNGATSKDLDGIAAGEYSVTVSRTGTSCTQILHATIVNVDHPLNITITPTDASCGQSDGSAISSVDPPSTYTYLWSNGSTAPSLENVPAGTYTLTVTAAGTCQDVSTTTIGELPPAFSIHTTSTPANCGMNDGAATVNVDPPGEYTYLWSNGQSASQLTAVGTGNYSVTVTLTGTNCSLTSSVSIEELPPAFTITSTTTSSDCGITDGTATLTIDPPGNYTYTWSDGQMMPEAVALAPGMYTVTVTLSGTDCSKSLDVTVDQLPPSFTLNSGSTPAACGMNDGSATVNVDPPGEYDYLWSDGQSTATGLNLSKGIYTVTVSIPGTNCSQNISITVDELPPSFVLSFVTEPADCGLSDGSATINVDPPGEYNYSWSDGQTTFHATSLSSGTYTVTVTTPGTSCSQSIEVDVAELPASFTVSTTSTPSGCGQPTGTATAVVDPMAEYTFQWSNGILGAQATGLSPGQYIVSVSLEGSSCVVTDTILVEQITPSFTGTITTVPADCGLSNGSAMISIDPMGSYTYLWSNQQSGPELQNVMTGQYEVVVTDVNFCTASFSAEVAENPVEYIDILNTTSATCIGGGEISFVLSTPGTGMLQVEIISPEGPSSLMLTPGSYLLSSFINMVPGTYTLTVYDPGIGQTCSENVSVTIDDQTPPLNVMDDFYSTTGENPVNENMLNNDSGLNLTVTGISNAVGGMVVFNSNGEFTYIPDPGFSGDGSFNYVVTDACGNTGSGTVIITVEVVNCNFTISTTLIPAHCGLSDGYIDAEVNESGTYTYFWNTGDTGPELIDVPADVYTVTIEDVNLGCSLEFEIELSEYPAEYIDNVNIGQPTCSTPGEISFDVNAPGAQDILTMVVMHPNGTNQFEIDPGTILISDFVDINPGTYTIQVFIGNAGPDCIDEFSATILIPPSLEIEAEAVFPPSSPTAMDGSATIVAILPGVLPYTVFVDGIPMATANSNTFTVGGMGIGMHTIQIEDANGCFSNILSVLIPFPDFTFSIGTSFSTFPFNEIFSEAANLPIGDIVSTGMLTEVNYHMGTFPQHGLFLYAPFSISRQFYNGYLIEVQHRSQLGSLNRKNIRVILEGGLGMQFGSVLSENFSSPFIVLNGNGTMRIGKRVRLETELGLNLWNHLNDPYWRIILNLPFIH